MKVSLDDFPKDMIDSYNRIVSIIKKLGYLPIYHLSKTKGSTYQRFRNKDKNVIWVGFYFIYTKSNNTAIQHKNITEKEIINSLNKLQ